MRVKTSLAPLFPVALALCAGIALAFECSLPFLPCLIAMAAALALTLALRRWERWQTLFMLLAAVAFGATLMAHHEAQWSIDLPEEELTYQGVIVSQPLERGKVVRFDLQLVGGQLNGKKVKVSLLRDTVQHRYRHLAIGDGFLAQGRIVDAASTTALESSSTAPNHTSVIRHSSSPQATNQHSTFNTHHFSYPLFLRCRNFVGTSFVFWNRWRKVELDLSPLSRLDRTALAALQMRQSMLHRYEHLGFDDDRLAVAIAMTLGDKSRLTNDLREVYSISGASHVLALSGLHIGIIYALMVLVVGYRRLGWLREVVVILGIWAYAFFTGLSPSVVRAAVMITVYSIVSLANRDRMSLNTLALTAIIMLVWNPLYLYDVGFQMSFMAVLFILLFYPTLFALLPERWIDKLSFSLTTRFPFVGHDTEADVLYTFRPLRWAWAMVVVSLCAQIGTCPLTMYYFGRFSVYFLLTNFLVIPLAIVILYLTAAMLLSSWWPAVQGFIAQPLIWIVDMQNTALRGIAALPGSHIENIDLSRLQVVLLYSLFMLLLLWVMKKKKRAVAP